MFSERSCVFEGNGVNPTVQGSTMPASACSTSTAQANGVIPGCPDRYNLLAASPFGKNNLFLYGRASVRLNASTSSAHHGQGLASLVSRFFPAVWYSAFQKHIPYSTERLSARKIMQEVALGLPYERYADEDESRAAFRKRVWGLLTDMRGDQKWYSLRFGSWLLALFFRWLFNGELYVNPDACSVLRALAPTSTFVYDPSAPRRIFLPELTLIVRIRRMPLSSGATMGLAQDKVISVWPAQEQIGCGTYRDLACLPSGMHAVVYAHV
jgi:hypothetical protein